MKLHVCTDAGEVLEVIDLDVTKIDLHSADGKNMVCAAIRLAIALHEQPAPPIAPSTFPPEHRLFTQRKRRGK